MQESKQTLEQLCSKLGELLNLHESQLSPQEILEEIMPLLDEKIQAALNQLNITNKACSNKLANSNARITQQFNQQLSAAQKDSQELSKII